MSKEPRQSSGRVMVDRKLVEVPPPVMLLLAFWFFGGFRCDVPLLIVILVSSPEHEVLMVSYCDQSMSVVRRASCVVNNSF